MPGHEISIGQFCLSSDLNQKTLRSLFKSLQKFPKIHTEIQFIELLILITKWMNEQRFKWILFVKEVNLRYFNTSEILKIIFKKEKKNLIYRRY